MHIHAPWVGPGLRHPVWDAQALQEAAGTPGATPASFQAPAEAYELWKRLTETEPNTWLPQKDLRTMIRAHRTQKEMFIRL